MQVVEPLSTSVLEECSVPGYGRFTAYSNGRIRVVFEDRTALDMVADFSQRLKGCLKHSDYSQVQGTVCVCVYMCVCVCCECVCLCNCVCV